MNRWFTAFKDQDVRSITPRHIEQVLIGLQAERKKPATLVRHLAVLKAAFNWAIRVELVQHNPAARVQTAKPNNVIVRYLTAEQEAKLLASLPSQYHCIVVTALNTGLRQGELLGLRWSDVDSNIGMLKIGETKAGGSRQVPMNSIVMETLTALKTISDDDLEGRIFRHGARYVRRAFERAVKRAGLAPFRFHDLRHTFASRLAMQGANDRTLMALGGWKSPAMLSRYAHLSPTHLYQAVEGLTRTRTATKKEQEFQTEDKLLKDLVSRLGLEPRALALKGLTKAMKNNDFNKHTVQWPTVIYNELQTAVLYRTRMIHGTPHQSFFQSFPCQNIMWPIRITFTDTKRRLSKVDSCRVQNAVTHGAQITKEADMRENLLMLANWWTNKVQSALTMNSKNVSGCNATTVGLTEQEYRYECHCQ
jgi:integrase